MRNWSGFSIGGSRGLHWRGHDPCGIQTAEVPLRRRIAINRTKSSDFSGSSLLGAQRVRDFSKWVPWNGWFPFRFNLNTKRGSKHFGVEAHLSSQNRGAQTFPLPSNRTQGGLFATFCGRMLDPAVKDSFLRGSPIFSQQVARNPMAQIFGFLWCQDIDKLPVDAEAGGRAGGGFARGLWGPPALHSQKDDLGVSK